MYNHLLDTFMIVAEEGSFNKAATRLFISHTAVMKQINQLEDQLGVKLFNRDRQGLSLTVAGQSLKSELPAYLATSEQILSKIRNKPTVLRVGNSPLYPLDQFFDLWDQLDQSNLRLQVVPFQDDFAHGLINDHFDFFVGVFNDSRQREVFDFLPIGNYHLAFLVPKRHVLAKMKTVSPENLPGQKVMLLAPGISQANDAARKYLQRCDCQIIDVPERYSVQTFNDCVTQNCLLLAPDCWQNVHPALTMIKMAHPIEIPYGIVNAASHRQNVKPLIKLLKDDSLAAK